MLKWVAGKNGGNAFAREVPAFLSKHHETLTKLGEIADYINQIEEELNSLKAAMSVSQQGSEAR